MKDKQLNVPSEANREEQLNFLEADRKNAAGNNSDNNRFDKTMQDDERTNDWKEAMEEAENDRNKNSE